MEKLRGAEAHKEQLEAELAKAWAEVDLTKRQY